MKPEDDSIEVARQEILQKLAEVEGCTIGQLDTFHLLQDRANKGVIGQIIERYLGKPLDSKPTMDFPEAGLELKVTGIVRSGKMEYRAKERLVLHQINFVKDAFQSFEDSGLLEKCRSMLISLYEYRPSLDGSAPDYASFPLLKSFVYEMTDEDIKKLRVDYDKIMSFINEGRAELLSEGFTDYLAACTKSADSSVRTPQYGGGVPCKPRAFCLKQSFITTIIQQYVGHTYYELCESLAKRSIMEELDQKLEPYFGMTIEDICGKFSGLNPSSKNFIPTLIARLLGISHISRSDELNKANVCIKTIRVNKNGHIRESMSFKAFDFFDVAYTPFEESEWCTFFKEAQFYFVVFRETERGYVFEKTVPYHLPEEIVETNIRRMYERTAEVLRSGNIVASVKTIRGKNGSSVLVHSNNFPKSSDDEVCHVRPHSTDFRTNQKQLPVTDSLTRRAAFCSMAFWLNNDFVGRIIK